MKILPIAGMLYLIVVAHGSEALALENSPADAIPVPADYDGDGCTDMSLKGSNGIWYIDLCGDQTAFFGVRGFGGRWDFAYPGYGDATAIPVPADYDGDGKADLAVKDAHGMWGIDYARNHFGVLDEQHEGYGNAAAVPVPADYDGDGKADLAVKDASGTWYIDFASNGFHGWDEQHKGYGNAAAVPVPADYDGDGKADLAVKDASGTWYIDFASNGFHGWDVVPGTTATMLDNPGRPLFNTSQPYIEWTKVYTPIDRSPALPRAPLEANKELSAKAPLINGQYHLRIGVRYTVAVRINPGAVQHPAGLEVNPDLHVPAALALENPVGTTFKSITTSQTRSFGVTCTQAGSYPLGYMFRDGVTGSAFNPDYGIGIACASLKTGLYGTVTARAREGNGRYIAGGRIAGATVAVTGPATASTVTATDGSWRLPTLTGGPYMIKITATGKAQTIAVNVSVPEGSGTEIDTPLEEPFALPAGITYTTYVDYARGRTILHTIKVDTTRTSVKLARSEFVGHPIRVYKNLIQLAQQRGAPVVMNGGYFDAGGALGPAGDTPDPGDDEAVGYFYGAVPPSYAVGYVPSLPLSNAGTVPMLGIAGSGTNQQISITQTEANFLANTAEWTQTALGPIFDRANPKGVSDFTYAMQMNLLLMNGVVGPFGSPDMAWAFSTVGKNGDLGTTFWLVVADGEGVNGGNGATFHQLGQFYKDVLGATEAMALDGGLSTELVLCTASGAWRNINTITGEESSWDLDPNVEGEIGEMCCGAGGISGGIGSVFDYLSVASQASQVTQLTVNEILEHPDHNHQRLFNLKIDGDTVLANGTGSSGPRTVSPGNHTVSETGGTGTKLGAFDTVIGGDCAANGAVTLAQGDNKICTITNYDHFGGCSDRCCEPGSGTQGCQKCGSDECN
jgi:hypothetical protein